MFAAAWLAMVIFRANRLLRVYLEIRPKYDGMYRKDAGVAQGWIDWRLSRRNRCELNGAVTLKINLSSR